MKLKLDENGNVVVQDGKPVYVHDDGKEVAFDAPATVAKISQLNGEAKSHRERAEEAEAKLKPFEGIDDPEAARAAIETVANIDSQKLVDAGKVDEIKEQAVKAYKDQLTAAQRTHAEELKALTEERDAIRNQYHSETIGSRFASSKFIGEKTVLPGPAAQKIFGDHFKVEDGKTVAYDNAGNKLYSRANPGELADFEEAIESLVSSYPYRDNILKGTGSGSGADGSGKGTGNGGKTITRSEFDALPQEARAAKMNDGFEVVDG